MKNFRPQAVPPSSWRDWLLEAFTLITARGAWHVPLALTVSTACAVLPQLPGLVLGVTSLGVFAVMAQATVDHIPLRQALRASARVLVLITLGFFLAMATAVALLHVALPAPTASHGGLPLPGTTSSPLALDFAPGAWLLSVLALVLACPGSLFFLALLVFVRAPLLLALDLSVEAVRLNRFTIAVSLGLAALLVLGAAWTGLTVVGLLPWTGAFLFVAYRHVFLGVPPRVAATATAITPEPAAPPSPLAEPHATR